MDMPPSENSTRRPGQTIDASIRQLVDALNAFRGIRTIGSCGGHPEPVTGGQWPAGAWYVKFRVDQDEAGWRALEFLAWLINNAYQRAEHHVTLYPTAPPPYLNTPGQVLAFALEGFDGEDPNQLAECMDRLRAKAYVPPPAKRRPSWPELARLPPRARRSADRDSGQGPACRPNVS
jgi:hypothetical protein